MAKPSDMKAAKEKMSRGRPAMSAAKRDEMRRRIADAAHRLFKADGYSKVSMRRIAAEVGCTPMALYNYYDSKIDILRTLWDSVFDTLFAEIAAFGSDTDKTAYLTRISSAYVNYWLRNEDHYRLVFMAEGVTQPDVSIFLDGRKSLERFAIFAEALIDANDAPMDSDQLKRKLDLLICLLHGIAHNQLTISGYPWTAADMLIEDGVKAIIGG
ncbi:MAG: TetR/AcrR family transcriptional regulator [Pseudomonadota bacterium]